MLKYLEEAKERARSSVAEKLRSRILAKRSAEKTFAKFNVAPPFSSLVWEDIEKARADGTYQDLMACPEFQTRVKLLEFERVMILHELQEAEEQAVQAAMENLPPDVELASKHERERSLFLSQRGLADEVEVTKAPTAVRAAYSEMLEKQNEEIKTLRA